MVERSGPGSNKPDPAITKRGTKTRSYMELTYVTPSVSRASSRTASPVSVYLSLNREGQAGSANKRPHRRAEEITKVFITSSDSEEEPPCKSSGRSALDLSHEGQYTADAMARRAEAKKAKQLKRDHRAILDSEVLLLLAPAKKASLQAMELARVR